MNVKRISAQATAVVALLAISSPALASLINPRHEEDDVNIGVSGAGQLVVEFGDEQISLPAVSGLLNGFLGDEPGFFTIDEDEPDEDIFVIGAGANIVLEVISFDDALKAWTPGFAAILSQPGDTWSLGAAPFDTHPFWHIDSDDAGYIAPPLQTKWSATFRLLDTGSTGYSPSEPIMVTFTPEPGSLGLLAIGAALLVHRRTR